jgi:hypothetical protein
LDPLPALPIGRGLKGFQEFKGFKSSRVQKNEQSGKMVGEKGKKRGLEGVKRKKMHFFEKKL